MFPSVERKNRIDHVDNVGNRRNDGLVSVVSNWSLTSLSSAEGHPQNGEILGKRRERGGCSCERDRAEILVVCTLTTKSSSVLTPNGLFARFQGFIELFAPGG